MWVPNGAAVLESWSDQGFVDMVIDVWFIGFKVSILGAKMLMSL